MNAIGSIFPSPSALPPKGGNSDGEFLLDCEPEPFANLAAAKAKGFIYVAVGYAADQTPFYKVGFSQRPEQRVKQLNSASPFRRCELLVSASGRMIDELAAHEFLKAYSENKEWYRPSRRLERLIYYIAKHGALPAELVKFADSCAATMLAKRHSREAMDELSALFSGRIGCREDWPRMGFGPNSGPDRSNADWAFAAIAYGRTKAAKETVTETNP